MPTEEGYIKLWRSMMYSDVWACAPHVARLAIDCTMLAEWRGEHKGSFVTSERALAEFCNQGHRKLRRALEKLEQLGFIKIRPRLRHEFRYKPGSFQTVIIVVNYSKYQETPANGVSKEVQKRFKRGSV